MDNVYVAFAVGILVGVLFSPVIRVLIKNLYKSARN